MRLLMVFLKEPIAGRVKTRLARDVGDENASQYYKVLVEVLLRQLRGLNNCRIRFYYTPDDASEAIRFWILSEMSAISGPSNELYLAPSSHLLDEPSQEIDFHPQGDGDLGDRMTRAFTQGFNEGFDEICVIGSDCPECGARWINAAFSRLSAESSRQVIIGPSQYGDYYLLALKSAAPSLFEEIPQSASKVLEATLSAASAEKLSVELLPSLSAVTNLPDWERILKSPLGAALKKALGEHVDNESSEMHYR